MRLIVLVVVLIFVPLLVSAQEGNMPLLAVRETSDGLVGSSAELYLEIQVGSGRVFVDTYPLSKLDTQISMRLAKEIACDFLDEECDDQDFIYTLRADSPIIGGPSAGAAATVLTVSVLSGTPLRENIAMTGTINSGGLVGPVGGVREKIEAAAEGGITTVLVPLGESVNESNQTIEEFGRSLGVEVIEVIELDDAVERFTGRRFNPPLEEIDISLSYQETMKVLAEDLCERNEELRVEASRYGGTEGALNMSEQAVVALLSQRYYSAASFCFGSNVRLSQVIYQEKNLSEGRYTYLKERLFADIDGLEAQIRDWKIRTITDLESFMVVKERLDEAREIINQSNQDSRAASYAFAAERLRSAYSWTQFYGNPGQELVLDEESLKESCRRRMGEAEERLQYATLSLPFSLDGARNDLEQAYHDVEHDEFALCLFRASKAKAQVNIVLTSLGVQDGLVDDIIETKLRAARRIITKASVEGVFPLLGYSYFEYATSLREDQPFSALLYAEYALELSNLDLYFQERKPITERIKIDLSKVVLIAIGVVIGLMGGLLVKQQAEQMPRKRR